MKRILKKIFNKTREQILGPSMSLIDEQVENLKILADINFRNRSVAKRLASQPIRVIFVCHEPSLWGMFESIYEAMEADPLFYPIVVVLPYKHATLADGQYKDAGMMEFCESNNIRVIQGYDKKNNEWLTPASLLPDYVFFQTPYDLYHKTWVIGNISLIARVCYIPYGSSVSKGEIFETVHPENFFKHTHFFFLENNHKKDFFVKKFGDKKWFNNEKVIVSGYPKLDYLKKKKKYNGAAWRRGTNKGVKRILWTPRFLTSEGACHFFEYKKYFFDFCNKHPYVDFIFRPHPLCFQNFVNTGEMSLDEQRELRQRYELSSNMSIDESGSYEDTFVTSDLLISDFSSMMVEYFATGKPIIYTHRKNLFNEYAFSLSKGFYWVKNIEELDKALNVLLSENDLLLENRKILRKTLIYIPEDGAAAIIKDRLALDYNSSSIII